MALVEVNWKPSSRQLRSFGFVAVVALGLLGALIYFTGWFLGFSVRPDVAYVLWAVGAVSGLLAVSWPPALLPLYLVLSLISLPIGFVVSYVVMALLFYGVITPIGLALRLAGKDAMTRKFDPDAESYWIRRKTVTDPQSYFRQF